MFRFEQTEAKLWTVYERGVVIGTIKKLDHGYNVDIPECGYNWTWEKLNDAQDAFLEND